MIIRNEKYIGLKHHINVDAPDAFIDSKKFDRVWTDSLWLVMKKKIIG